MKQERKTSNSMVRSALAMLSLDQSSHVSKQYLSEIFSDIGDWVGCWLDDERLLHFDLWLGQARGAAGRLE
ncbi:unnamed protein product [Dovyalis caffra]|uniref:Uncharacterized protein n=1 Tax=Dovyalis caffra TaxID=77055 RepID=A0AAV1S5Y9_9ROSI|nr:unnamed protein product [Dovyalis caffra]